MRQLLLDNLLLVRFLYGLSFFGLGMVVALQPRPFSRYRLAGALPSLATFAFLHAFGDWGLVFIPLQVESGAVPAFLVGLKTVVSAVSFGFLLHFGVSLLQRTFALLNRRWLGWLPLGLTLFWLLAFMFYPIVVATADIAQWFAVSEVWARYLLGLPASLVASLALLTQRDELRRDGLVIHIASLYSLSAVFAGYGLAAGLVVPDQPIWLASIVNTERFIRWFGIPVELIRAAAGLLIALFTYRLLDIFNVETARRLQQVEEERAVLNERERIARDLHDSILQILYGVGLGLKQAETRSESPGQAERLSHLTGELHRAIGELRRYVLGLKESPVEAGDVRQSLEELVERVREFTGLHVTLAVEGLDAETEAVRVPYSLRECLLLLARESLSNVVRHAGAQEATVLLAWQEDSLLLRIQDNGRGFDPLQPEGSVGQGLQNMRRRVEMRGGLMQVDAAPGRGTRLLFHLPVEEAPAETDPEREGRADEQAAPGARGG